MTRCLSPDEFADYLDGNRNYDDHVSICVRCRTLAKALIDATSVEDLSGVIEDVRRGRMEAQAAVQDLEAALPSLWPALAGSDARLHSPGSVSRLLVRAREVTPATPRRALALAEVAAKAAARAGASISPSLCFELLKDLAWYRHRVDDDVSGASEALDDAAALVDQTDDPEYRAAVLAHARAYLFGGAVCAQWDRALELLDACEPVFLFRDESRWRMARHLRAAVLLRASRYDEAAALYGGLAGSETDEYQRATLRSDLAECFLRTGRYSEAASLAEDSLRVQALGHRALIEYANTMGIHGEALSALGRHDEAIAKLLAVERVYAGTGLRDDELRAGLAVVRALLAADADADVRSRLDAAYLLACALDQAQPLRSGALRAAVWADLCSLDERGAMTEAALSHAAEYLRTVGRGDEVAFAPLQ